MNPFACTVDLSGAPVGADAVTHALPALTAGEGPIRWLLEGCWGAAWVPSGGFERPLVVRHRELLAIGVARLDNASELRGALSAGDAPNDLALVAAAFRREGARGMRRLVGEFAVVLWDAQRHVAFAARDALGLRSLYYGLRGTRLTFGSHPECFERGELDRDYFRAFLTGAAGQSARTAYAGIRPVRPGCWLVADGRQLRGDCYWHPAEFSPARAVRDVGEAVAEFRSLLAEAVAAQTREERSVWSQLSGGLDSSSVVGMACHLAQQGRGPGLSGTVTAVDRLGDGDETRFSDAVVDRWAVPNFRVEDYWAWQSDADGPSVVGGPRHFLPFYARDRALCGLVRRHGGRVLLSGYGADQYLSGGSEFIADRFAAGEFRRGVADLVELAVTGRQSFWALAWRHGLEPLAPPWLRRRPGASPPAWVLGAQPTPPTGARGTGSRFGDRVAAEMAAAELLLNRGPFEDGLEVRYPFLHRPLVEFGLQLPPELRVRPHRQKWILREAVGDLLPPAVAGRSGKGGIDARVLWSFRRERRLLRRLIASSHLADLGLVDPNALAEAFEQSVAGNGGPTSPLFFTLAAETWLAVRSGWWSRHVPPDPAAAVTGALPPEQEKAHEEATIR